MKHEFKIIMSSDENGWIDTGNTKVYLDDKQIGAIQSIKMDINVERAYPNIEITLPDIPAYMKSLACPTNGELSTKTKTSIEKLSEIENIKIILTEIT